MDYKKKFTYLSEDGSFPPLICIRQPLHLRLVLNSTLIKQYDPLLITSLYQSSKKLNQFTQWMKLPHEATQIQDISITPTYTRDGDCIWELKIDDPNRVGSHFMRVVWMSREKPVVAKCGKVVHFVMEERRSLLSVSLINVADDYNYNYSYHYNQGFSAIHINRDAEIPAVRKGLIFTDILLNHTSDQGWLIEPQYEQAVYNEHTVPQLKSALMLDQSLQNFSMKLANKEIKEYSQGNIIQNIDELHQLSHLIWIKCFVPLKLENYFILDTKKVSNSFKIQLREKVDFYDDDFDLQEEENIFVKSPYDRLKDLVMENTYDLGVSPRGVLLRFEPLIQFYEQYWKIIHLLRQNVTQVSFESFTKALEEVNKQLHNKAHKYLCEAMEKQDTRLLIQQEWLNRGQQDLMRKENNIHHPLLPSYFTRLSDGRYAANWGWISNQDSESDVCESEEFNYLRRRVQIRTDCIKLRYGVKKITCPALWKLTKYSIRDATQHYDGLWFIHSNTSQIAVTSYMVSKARKIKPNLIVAAEYNGSHSIKFATMIGINAFIQDIRDKDVESLVKALTYYSGNEIRRVGSLLKPKLSYDAVYSELEATAPSTILNGGCDSIVLMALQTFSKVHQGFVNDQYFDEGELKIESREQQIRLVYAPFREFSRVELKYSFNGWQESLQMQYDCTGRYAYIDISVPEGVHEYKFIEDSIWRNDPYVKVNMNTNHELVAHYPQTYVSQDLHCYMIKLNKLKQQLEEQYQDIDIKSLGQGFIMITRYSRRTNLFKVLLTNNNQNNHTILINLPGILLEVDEIIEKTNQQYLYHRNLQKYGNVINNNVYTVLRLSSINNQTVIMLTCSLKPSQIESLKKLNNLQTLPKLNQEDANYLYFSSSTHKELYDIPGLGKMPYEGFYGLYHFILEAQRHRSKVHPLFKHMQEGNWLLDYLRDRIKNLKTPSSQSFREQVLIHFQLLHSIPPILMPHHFTNLITHYIEHIGKHNQFTDILRLSLLKINTSQLTRWTLVAFKGAFLLDPQRRSLGREVLLRFARHARHSLIPNTVGAECRFNSRDSTWWWVRALSSYLQVTEDWSILEEKLQMVYLDDDEQVHLEKVKRSESVYMSMTVLMQRLFQGHANGIRFVEWRAGYELQSNMQREGFMIQLKVDQYTGFIVGGNDKNCNLIVQYFTQGLTWMDKVCSNQNKFGIPDTPRDGAPIECTALLKMSLDFIHSLYIKKLYPYEGIRGPDGKHYTFKQWSLYIQQNFCRNYWVPIEQNKTFQYVRRKGIYKDTTHSSHGKGDFQFRPNACIAIALAPELFQQSYASHYISMVESVLIGPHSLGIMTLDPQSSQYTQDEHSLHNGPEWVWLVPFFLTAHQMIEKRQSEVILSYLSRLKRFVQENKYFAVPTYCNANGLVNSESLRDHEYTNLLLLELNQ